MMTKDERKALRKAQAVVSLADRGASMEFTRAELALMLDALATHTPGSEEAREVQEALLVALQVEYARATKRRS